MANRETRRGGRDKEFAERSKNICAMSKATPKEFDAPLMVQFGIAFSSQPVLHFFSQLPRVPKMASESPDSKGSDRMISTSDHIIPVLDRAKDACGIPLAQAAYVREQWSL